MKQKNSMILFLGGAALAAICSLLLLLCPFVTLVNSSSPSANIPVTINGFDLLISTNVSETAYWATLGKISAVLILSANLLILLFAFQNATTLYLKDDAAFAGEQKKWLKLFAALPVLFVFLLIPSVLYLISGIAAADSLTSLFSPSSGNGANYYRWMTVTYLPLIFQILFAAAMFLWYEKYRRAQTDRKKLSEEDTLFLLKEFRTLKEEGILTEEEFQAKKEGLLQTSSETEEQAQDAPNGKTDA